MACQVKGEDLGKKRETRKNCRFGKKLLLLFLTGLLLLVIVLPFPKKSDSEDAETGTETTTENRGSYERYLEQKTEEALQCVEGVGNVKVMITLKSSEENVVEKDQQSDGQSVEEEDSQGGKRMTKETSSDKTSIYEQKSDGTQVPYVSKKLSPEVEGVIVIADGGDNAVVVQNITGAIQALYGWKHINKVMNAMWQAQNKRRSIVKRGLKNESGDDCSTGGDDCGSRLSELYRKAVWN